MSRACRPLVAGAVSKSPFASCSVTSLRKRLSSSTTRTRILRFMQGSSLSFGRLARNPQPKATAGSFLRFDVKRATQRFGQRPGDGQTEPVTLPRTFGAEERIEHFCDQIRRDPVSRVRHFDGHAIAVPDSGNADRAATLAQRVDGVAQKIIEYLAHHRRIGRDFTGSFVEVDFEFYQRRAGSLQRDLRAIRGDRVEVAHYSIGLPLASQIQKAPSDLFATQRLAHNLFQVIRPLMAFGQGQGIVTLAQVVIAASGLLISCATPAASLPTLARRRDRESCSFISRNRVTSVQVTTLTESPSRKGKIDTR